MYVTTFFAIYLTFVVPMDAKYDKNCDALGILLYEDLGCTAVRNEVELCPIKYECDDFTKKNDSCLFRGITYRLNEEIKENFTYPNCDIGCVCENATGIECAELDCPEYEDPSIESGCHRKYSLDECCSTGTICPSEGETLTECNVNGKKYKEGEEFWPEDSCSKCVCGKNWTGNFEAPFCKRSTCNAQIHHRQELHNKCAPVYLRKKKRCCPDAWVCPSSSDIITKVNNEVDPKSDVTCAFGFKTLNLGEGLQKKLKDFGSEKNVECECIIPPFLTCKDISA